MILTIVLVIVDHIAKLFVMEHNVSTMVIPNILNITYVENRGMVFGMAQGSSLIMAFVSLIICVAICVYIAKNREDDNFCYAWYLILAGGIGNMIDRFEWGYVVDFIDTPWIATFNFADCFIVFGVFVLIIQVVLDKMSKC